MIAVFARIIARYLAGALVLYGVIDQAAAEATQGDLALLCGGALAALAEASYALARRNGWST